MLKSLTGLVHTIGDQAFHFICDPSSPLESVEEALLQFMVYVKQIKAATAKAQAEAKAAQETEESSKETPKEEVKTEVIAE